MAYQEISDNALLNRWKNGRESEMKIEGEEVA